MIFHIFGFFICNSLLQWLGVFKANDSEGLFTFAIEDNFLLLIVYVSISVGVSLGLIYLWRYLRKLIVN